MQTGRFKSKLCDYGFRLTSGQKLVLFLKFNVNGENVEWTGVWSSDEAKERIKNTLSIFGFKEYDRFHLLADGPESGLLDIDKEVEVSIQIEKNQNGKEFFKVAFVNEIKDNRLKADEVAKILGIQATQQPLLF